ncbi:MAG: hypothetical protein ACRCW9_05890 [Cetobacterium sp.]
MKKVDLVNLFKEIYDVNINEQITCIVTNDGTNKTINFKCYGNIDNDILKQVNILAKYIKNNLDIANAKEYFEVFDESEGDFVPYKWGDKN